MGGLSLDRKFRDAGVAASRGNLINIDPDALIIVDNEEHELYDPRIDMGIDKDFLADIKKHGVLNPVTVWRDGEDEAGVPRLLVVAGRRRVMHARKAKASGLDIRVPCVTVSGAAEEMVLRAISENAHRADETIYTKAFKIKRALELGATKGDIRVAAKMSPNSVNAYLQFLDLDPKAQKIFMERNAPISAIEELAKLPRAEQVKALGTISAVEKSEGRVKANDVKAAVATAKGKDPGIVTTRMVPKKKVVTYLSEIRENLKKEGESEVLQAQARMLDFLLGNKDALIKGTDIKPSWFVD